MLISILRGTPVIFDLPGSFLNFSDGIVGFRSSYDGVLNSIVIKLVSKLVISIKVFIFKVILIKVIFIIVIIVIVVIIVLIVVGIEICRHIRQ